MNLPPETLQLTPEIVNKLVILLRPFMNNEQERRSCLIQALGTGHPVLSRINWTGSTDPFIVNMIDLVNSDHQIVPLLKQIKSMGGVDHQQAVDNLKQQLQNPSPSVSTSEGTRLQDLYKFTVQIHNIHNSTVVGTGIIINGRVVTTLSVIQQAGIQRGDNDTMPIPVRLPKTTPGIERNHKMEIAAYLENYQDDIVVLRFTDLQPPIPDNLRIGRADQSHSNSFRSYVYTGQIEQPSDYIEGEILGYFDPANADKLAFNPIRLNVSKMVTSEILPAMSGGGVLDTQRNLVVGILAEKIASNKAAAVDTYVLSLEPLVTALNNMES